LITRLAAAWRSRVVIAVRGLSLIRWYLRQPERLQSLDHHIARLDAQLRGPHPYSARQLVRQPDVELLSHTRNLAD
jgi:hypothetical protein